MSIDLDGEERLELKDHTYYSKNQIFNHYNGAYLKDILAHIPSDEVVVKLNSSISAALFYPKTQEGNTELTTLLMPIRLNE